MVFTPLRADDLPELGDVASNELSLSAEKKIGTQIMHEIRWREPSYLDDSDVEAYLNQLGGRLASVSNDPGMGFFFFPINDASINAFAMPGGFIGVHTGLILSAQTESELAGVMAHEISHVTQRHIARQVFQSKQLGMAAMLAMGLALLAARSNGQVAGAAMATTQAGAISAQLAFSRDFEREADRLGFDIMRRAGFDVRGMSVFFTRLQQAVRLYENNATAYLRSHPLTGERLTDMQNREQSLPYHQVQDSVDFQLVRAKLRALQGTPGEAVRDFETLLQDKKYIAEAATRYGLAYARYRGRDWAGAERDVLAARRMKVSAAMLERLLADIHIAQGDVGGGLRVYRDAMVRFPLNHGLLYGYGGALIGARHFDDALAFVETQLQSYPEDVRWHKMRAESYAGLGRKAQQHRALAEVFALQGQTAGAVEQLELAQKAGDANFYELSTIDARLRELKQRRFEEMKEKRN
ncbi:M48 family metalloprotease [Dechloromonas denitrificans]|uniref:beta-barrel assembly-enhancing protease n=1 Tax=Dechloromonas denitrificans TaxID=281362 RepID=UPI001CF984AC|nr:M48 family metalloprotease [Dechloromonas denitrificans]